MGDARIRRCSICKHRLPLAEDYFYRNTSKPDGWGTECKPCHIKRSVTRRTDKRRAFIEVRGLRCEKCGIEHENYRFFDVDHIRPLAGRRTPSTQYDYSDPDNLQVLCPNCHRIKTMTDMEWGKYD